MPDSKKLNFNKMADLKKTLGHFFTDLKIKDFPKEIIFSRGIEFPKFKITIEQVEEDFFVDQNGTKWMKIKEDDLNHAIN